MKKKYIAAAMLALLLVLSILLSCCTVTDPTAGSSGSSQSSGSSESGSGNAQGDSQASGSGGTAATTPSVNIIAPSGSTTPTGSGSSIGSTGSTAPTTSSQPTSGTTNPSLPTTPPEDKVYVNVTFVIGEGMADRTQSIELGTLLSQPVLEQVSGKYFAGWYANKALSGQPFDFSQPVTADMTLYAKWLKRDSNITYVAGGYESAALEWKDTEPAKARVGYRVSGTSAYTYVDAPLIRAKDSATARVDVVGLLGGGTYDFIIQTGSGASLTVEKLQISSYDRSGYAHFNYSEGVGAYENSGVLKSGALVIYLTESNKNNILASAYVDGKQVDISAYMGGGQYKGIGELLNNRRYSGSDRFDVGIAKLCQVYGSVTIRVIGTVTAQQNSDGTSTITGLTDYDSTGNGGSTGDNGRMARMVNAKNLTIEGIGEDACIHGWGLHFIANDPTNQHEGAGKSFEVRNLRFEDYPEDAIGMEGIQGEKVSASGEISGSTSTNAKLLSPVERCWIHHNSFYPGYCENPAESDKAEGDGSCDFKRGRYYTLSYNYFVDCHKTNLIGSSDDSLQYDITFHHNYWENCGSRMPLLRNANLHFYNNYISNDITMTYGTTGSKLSLSYVSSVRANSYMFAEANYYDGCKNPVQVTSGGAVKAYGNMYYACYEDDQSNKVTNRTDKVSNSCQFAAEGINYSSFDTDSKLFYYDAEAQRSDCYLTDAVTARLEVMQKAGTMKREGTVVDTAMNQYTPSSALQMSGSELTVNLSNVTAGSTVSGIYFAVKGSSAGLKGKGQVIAFTLLSETEIQVTVASGKDVNLGELVDSTGKVWAGKFTSFTGDLPAGTYFIASGSKDKEVTVTSLSFRSAATPAQKIAAAEAAINAIPATVTLDAACKAAIDAADVAYSALTESQRTQVSNAEKLSDALAQYTALEHAQKPLELKQKLEALAEPLTRETAAQFADVKAIYDSLNADKRGLTASEQAKYTRLLEQYNALKQTAVVAIFTKDDPSLATAAGFTVSGNYKSGASFVYDGKTYNSPLKMESATSVSFTATGSVTVTVKLDAAGAAVKIDGTKHTADDNGIVEVTLAAGSHTITKGDSCNLCYIVVE